MFPSGGLIHINGAPGVGKLTIARLLGKRLNARVLDNHAIYNVAFALTNFQTPEFFEAVRAVRRASYEQILKLPKDQLLILTDAYFEDSDWARESWKAVEELARARGLLLSVALFCEPAEHRRRIVSADRTSRGKVTDARYVDGFAERRPIADRGDVNLGMDVTNLTADAAAAQIADWVGRWRQERIFAGYRP